MEESWENFHLNMELDCCDDYFIDTCDKININSDDFLREILLETPPRLINSESENGSLTVDVNEDVEVVKNMVKSNSSNSVVFEQEEEESKSVPGRCCLPKTCILSFDNSTMIPATPQTCVKLEGKRDFCSKSKNKRNRESSEMMTRNEEKRVKKGRSSSQCVDHIMAERKRRQELTERFIALSATIPNLSKTDKASILRAAVDYVKQLQERVHELEKQDKNVGVTSMMILKKPNLFDISINNGDKNSAETSSDDDDDCNNNILPEIEARVMEKEVLIEIYCKKQIGIELKLLSHMENFELFVIGSNVLPFGKSDIFITVIAQKGEGYKVKVNDLVKSIRRVILKSEMRCESDLF